MTLTLEKWTQQAELLEREIQETLAQIDPPSLVDIMCGYQMGHRSASGEKAQLPAGKHLRPSLCLMMCSGLGGNELLAMPAAACLEIIHRSSLVFDDIQDNGLERNNRPTVPSVWGARQALNGGLALSCYARLALQRMRGKGLPDRAILDIMDILERTVIRICYGQTMDVSKSVVNVDGYMELARAKTGALFGAACQVGALVALCQQIPQHLVRAESFGDLMGIAFQMHDDYLGIWGEDARVGKTSSDLMERKRSLPVVLALEQFGDSVMTSSPIGTFSGWLTRDYHIGLKEVENITQWMERKGIRSQCLLKEADTAQMAMKEADIFPDELKKALLEFMKNVISRDS